MPQLLGQLGTTHDSVVRGRTPYEAVRMMEYGRDLVRGGGRAVAAQVHRAQTQVAQPGQGARPVLGVDEYPHAAAAVGRRAGQVQRHHHPAVRQLAETSCGHAVTPPCASVSIREPQDAPKHDRRQPPRGCRRYAFDLRFYFFLAEGPTWSVIVEPFRGSLTILIRVSVSVMLTPANGFVVS